jgi:hypothetical protein
MNANAFFPPRPESRPTIYAYTGINKHEGEDIGLYDTVITRKDAQRVFENIPAGAGYG